MYHYTMFIRFRKITSDGKRPEAADAKIMCAGYCQHRTYQECPVKPRCRWRIGVEHGLRLVPYRLNVALAENKRADGKVRQEHIAQIGSIDASWLPEFWEGINPALAAKIKGEGWEMNSLRVRTAFWKDANHRLKQLANRLGPDLKRIRIAAHARVPYPMEPERKKLELLEAKDDFDRAKSSIEGAQRMVATGKKMVKTALKGVAESEKLAQYEVRVGAAASAKLAKLSARSAGKE